MRRSAQEPFRPAVLAVAAILALPANMDAQRVTANLRAGTHGLSPGVTIAVSNQVSLRGDLSVLRYSHQSAQRVQQIDVDVTADAFIDAVAAIVDFHPFAGSLRLSVGVAAHSMVVNFAGVATSEYRVGALVLSPEEVGGLSGQVRTVNRVGPYVGIGIGRPLGGRVGYTVDLGAIHFHAPRLRLEGYGMLEPSDLEIEAFLEAIEGLIVYPVLAAGLSVQLF